jgi:hypothetical protein
MAQRVEWRIADIGDRLRVRKKRKKRTTSCRRHLRFWISPAFATRSSFRSWTKKAKRVKERARKQHKKTRLL